MNRFRVNEDKELIVDLKKVDKVIIIEGDEEIEVTEELIDIFNKTVKPILLSVMDEFEKAWQSVANTLMTILDK